MLGQPAQLRADKDVHEQLGTHNGRRDGKLQPADRGNGAERAVAETVRQRTQAYHDQQLQTVVLDGQGECGEALVPVHQAAHVALQDRATGDEGGDGADERCGRDDGPAVGEAVDEAGEGEERAVADEGRERHGKDEGPEDEPAGRVGAPFFRYGSEQAKDAFVVDEDEDGEDERDQAYYAEACALEGGESVVG